MCSDLQVFLCGLWKYVFYFLLVFAGPTSLQAAFRISIHVYFYCWICNVSNVAGLGNFVRTVWTQTWYLLLDCLKIKCKIAWKRDWYLFQINWTKYQNTVCPVKKFRAYFVVKHFRFVYISCNSRRLDMPQRSNNAHGININRSGEMHRAKPKMERE